MATAPPIVARVARVTETNPATAVVRTDDSSQPAQERPLPARIEMLVDVDVDRTRELISSLDKTALGLPRDHWWLKAFDPRAKDYASEWLRVTPTLTGVEIVTEPAGTLDIDGVDSAYAQHRLSIELSRRDGGTRVTARHHAPPMPSFHRTLSLIALICMVVGVVTQVIEGNASWVLACYGLMMAMQITTLLYPRLRRRPSALALASALQRTLGPHEVAGPDAPGYRR